MISGAICMSHTPLLDKARAEPDVERKFHGAVAEAAAMIAEWKPDLAVVFFPDHFNGFFYDLMPAFCVGVRAVSIGDFGTIPGALPVTEDLALDCANACLSCGVDIAVSYCMSVDHGCAQPIELLSAKFPLVNIVPVFVNCAAIPLPTFARAIALGAAVGSWAAAIDRRVLIIASGGLSHDPPLPSMEAATREQQSALVDNRNASHASRLARQNRIYAMRAADLRPINPSWDRALLAEFVKGDLSASELWTDAEVTRDAGRGGHEVRTWLAALAALKAAGGYTASVGFYHPIDEWLTGTALLTAQPAGDHH